MYPIIILLFVMIMLISLDVPDNNPIICDDNVDFGYEDNIFSMLAGNVQDFVSTRLL